MGLSFWWPTWGGRNFTVLFRTLLQAGTSNDTRALTRNLLEELVLAGERLNRPELNNTISFTPLRELTPSTIPSDLSDLSETASTPLSNEAEAGSEEEVENLISHSTTAPGTRSQTRAQAQALSIAQNAASVSTQPTASGSQSNTTPPPSPVNVPTASGSNPTLAGSPPPNPPIQPVQPIIAPPAQIQANPPIQPQVPPNVPNVPIVPVQAPPPPIQPVQPVIAPPAQVQPNPPVQPQVQVPAPPLIQVPVPPMQVNPPLQAPVLPPVAPPILPPQVPANPNAGLALANLPGRNERSAPSFDETQPQELDRYFSDLQALLHRYNIVAEDERKQAAVRYLSIQGENLWKTTSAWADPTRTFEEFKAEVFRLYPRATGDWTYTIQNLDLVIGHYAQNGILNAIDLGEYYRRFILISRYLISKGRLSTQEQSRSFIRGLPSQLEAQTRQRLQQRFIDHFPDDPYDLPDIYDAVSYVLMGSTSLALAAAPPPQQVPAPTPIIAAPSPSVPDPNSVKIEALTTLVASLGEMFKTAIQTQQAGPKPRSPGVTATGTNAPGTNACNFCGLPGHFIRECEVVAEYTRSGKCKRGPDGRVVLPSGAVVPRSITGAWLRDRVDEYHRQNPGQMAASMLFEVAARVTAPPNDAMGQSYLRYPAKPADLYSDENTARAYALRRPLPPRPEVVITTRPPRQNGRVGRGENAGGAHSDEAPGPSEEAPPHEVPETSAAKKGKNVEFYPETTHPFGDIHDAIHGTAAGPSKSALKPPTFERQGPAYTNTTKVLLAPEMRLACTPHGPG